MHRRRSIGCLLTSLLVVGGLSAVGAGNADAADSTPAPVRGVRLTAVTTTSATLQWVDPKTTGFRGVSIRRHDGQWSSDGSVFKVGTTGPVDQWSDTGLTPGATYSYGLYASYNPSGYAPVAVVTVTVPTAPSLTGTVTATTGGAGLGNVTVTATDNDGRVGGKAVTAANGSYAIAGLPAGGRYRICFSPALLNSSLTTGNGYLPTCRGGATVDTAVRVTAPASKLDGTLDGASSVAGTVRAHNNDGTLGASLPGVTVVLGNGKSAPVAYTTTAKYGLYRFAGVPAGTYTVCVDPLRSAYATTNGGQCWQQDVLRFPPTVITVKAATAVTNINFNLYRPDQVGDDSNAASTQRLVDEPCANVFFLAARGSGESGPGGLKAIYEEKNLGVGGPVLTAYQQLRTRLTAGGLTVTRPVSLAYRADNTLPDVGNGDYLRTVWTAVREARRALAERVAQCPNESIVFAGYGQGASIMRRVLTNATTTGVAALDPATLARVQAAVLLGDSDRVADDPVVRYGNAGANGQGVATQLDGSVSGRPVSAAMGLGVFEVCVDGDVLCDSHVPYGCTAATLATCAAYQAAYAYGVRTNLTAYDGTALTTAAADGAAARVLRAPHIVPVEALPDGTVGAAYSTALTTADNRAGTWTVGAGLPHGLSLQGSTISGTPDTVQYATFTATFTDTSGRKTSARLTIYVRPASGGVGTATRLPGNALPQRIWAAPNGDYLASYQVLRTKAFYVQWYGSTGPTGPALRLPSELLTGASIDEQNIAYLGIAPTSTTAGGSLIAFADGAASASVLKTFTDKTGSYYRQPYQVLYSAPYIYVAVDGPFQAPGCDPKVIRFSRAGLALATADLSCNAHLGAGGGQLTTTSGSDANYLDPKTLEPRAQYFTDASYFRGSAQGPTGDFAIVKGNPSQTQGNDPTTIRLYRITPDAGVVSETRLNDILGDPDTTYDDDVLSLTFTSDNSIVLLGSSSTGRRLAVIKPDGTVTRPQFDRGGLAPVPDGSGHVVITGQAGACGAQNANPATCGRLFSDRYDATSSTEIYTRGGTASLSSTPVDQAVGAGSLGLLVDDLDKTTNQTTHRVVVVPDSDLTPPGWPQP